MTPIPWLDGLPGIVILVDSDILGERVAGCRSFVMGGLPDGRVAGWAGGRVPSFVMGFYAPDERVPGAGGCRDPRGFEFLDERVAGCRNPCGL